MITVGTNFFWRDRPCGSCGRFDELHVCMSRILWRGYRTQLLDPQRPEWGFDEESPFGFPVLSIADWRRVFTERPGELRDEYGAVITDPVGWLDEADPARPGADEWRYFDDDIHDSKEWRDPAGFRFFAGEFS